MNTYPESINEKISLLILRVFGSFIFIIAGISHVVDTTGGITYLFELKLRGFVTVEL